MKNWKLELQLFADRVNEQDTDIPAEYADQFEGVSKEVALETLREAGLLQPKQTEVNEDGNENKGTQGNENDEQGTGDQTGGETSKPGEAQTGEQGAAKQPGEAKTGEDDPEKSGGDLRVALKIEREKTKQLKAELEKIKAGAPQPPQPVQQLPVNQPQVQQPQTQQNIDHNTPAYEDLLHDEAVKRFEQKYNRKPDFYDPEGKDIAKFNVMVRQVDMEVAAIHAQETEKQTKQTTINKDYGTFIQGIMTDDLFEVNKQKVIQAIDSLDPDLQEVIAGAARRLEAGKGSKQDLYIAQKFWNETVGSKPAEQTTSSEQSQKQTETTVIPVQTQTNKMDKVKQMEAHPRTNQINGSNTQGGYTVAELERMLQEKEWDEIPKEIQDLLKGVK